MCRLEYAGTTFVQIAEHSGHANVLRPAKPLPKHLRGSQAWNRLTIRCVLLGRGYSFSSKQKYTVRCSQILCSLNLYTLWHYGCFWHAADTAPLEGLPILRCAIYDPLEGLQISKMRLAEMGV